VEDAANTIVSVKRFMGRGLADIANAAQLPYVLEQPEDQGMVALSTRAGRKSPVEISAEILATCATAPKTVLTTICTAR
jgi:molecular chaperone HscA